MILLVLTVPFPWTWIFVFLAVFSLFFNTGPTNTILANVTHPSIRASAFAFNIFIIHALGDVISPPIIGRIADLFSLRLGFFVLAVMTLVGGMLWVWGARYLDRDTALAPTRLRAEPERLTSSR
jgi:MFS family permease